MPEAAPSQQQIDRRTFIQKCEPTDLIALIVITGGLILVGFHIDGIIGGILVSVVAYYFGKKGRTPTASA